MAKPSDQKNHGDDDPMPDVVVSSDGSNLTKQGWIPSVPNFSTKTNLPNQTTVRFQALSTATKKLPLFIPPCFFDCRQYTRHLGKGAFGSVFECNLVLHIPMSHKKKQQQQPQHHVAPSNSSNLIANPINITDDTTYNDIGPIRAAIKKMFMLSFNPYTETSQISTVIAVSGQEQSMPHPSSSMCSRYPFESEPLREVALASIVCQPLVTIHHVSISNDGALYTAMDSAKCDLLSLGPTKTYQQLMKYSALMLSCISYMHSVGIAHGDVKLSNFLLFADDSIRLGDLGMASSFILRPTRQRMFMYTKDYRPPEFWLPYRYSIEDLMRGDIWACAASIYTLCTGLTPADCMPFTKDLSALAKLCVVLGLPTEEMWPITNEMPKHAEALRRVAIANAKQHCIKNRVPTAFSTVVPIVMQLPQIPSNTFPPLWRELHKSSLGQYLPCNFIDLLRHMLSFNPRMRPTAKMCLNYPIMSEIRNSLLSGNVTVAKAAESNSILEDSGGLWLYVLADYLHAFASPYPLQQFHGASSEMFKSFMSACIGVLRRIRKEMDSVSVQLREKRQKHSMKTKQKKKHHPFMDAESPKQGISVIDSSFYPRSGFAEYSESIAVCSYMILQRLAIEVGNGKIIPDSKMATEYAISAFVTYDSLRRFKSYGVTKYMLCPYFKHYCLSHNIDYQDRKKAQNVLGALAFTTITILNFDFARPTPWDVATLMVRYLCESISGIEGATFMSKFSAIVLENIDLMFTDLSLISTYTVVQLGSMLADKSINDCKNFIPQSGAKVVANMMQRIHSVLCTSPPSSNARQ